MTHSNTTSLVRLRPALFIARYGGVRSGDKNQAEYVVETYIKVLIIVTGHGVYIFN